MGTPAGRPVRIAIRDSPCDSPAVSNLNMGNHYGSNNLELHRTNPVEFDS